MYRDVLRGDRIEQVEASAAKQGALIRQLGLGDSISLIMGIMIGSGIFLMAGSIAQDTSSVAAVMGLWVLGGVLSLAGALSLSELGAAFPSAGGLYVYLLEAYGPATGFVYGWSAISLIHAGSIATMAAAVGFYAAPLLGLGHDEQKLLQVGSIAFFTAVNCLGMVMGKRVQNTLTVVKVAGIALMAVVLYTRGSMAMLRGAFVAHGSQAPHLASLGMALIAVLWAYDGWHFVSFTAGEVRNPTRTLPRSLLLGTVLTSCIYLVVNVGYYAVLAPPSIRGTDRVAAAAITSVLGPRAGIFISLLIILSILGTMNGIILGAPRVNFAMARDGLFFRSFGRLSRRTHAPVIATVAQGAWAMVFTLIGSFRDLFTSYVFTSWIFYGLCVAGVLLLRRRRPELNRPYLCPLYPLTPLFFVAASLGIVITNFVVNFRHALLGVGLILLGLPLYFFFRYIERDRPPELSNEVHSEPV